MYSKYSPFLRFGILAPVLVLGLTGCSNGARERQVQPVLDAHVSDASDGSPQTPDAQAPPNSLSTVVNRVDHAATKRFLHAMASAFSNDASLHAISLRMQASERRATALENPIRPDISANAQTYGDGVSVIANQPLYDFGKRKAQIAQVRADGLSQTAARSDQQEDLLRAALDAVLDNWFLSETVSLRSRQIADLKDALKSAARLEQLNLITAADMRFAEVELQRAEIEMREAQNDAEAAQRVWHNVAGSAPVPPSLNFNALRKAAGIETLAKAGAVSLQRNLEIRSLDVNQQQLKADVSVLERQNSPTINATVEGITGGSDRGINGGLTVSFPIYRRDTKDDAAQVRSQIGAVDAARISVQRDLIFEIQQRGALISSLQSLVNSQRGSLRLLNLRVRDLSLQLEAGLTQYDDYLSAQIDFNDAELEILSNQNAIRRAQSDIVLLSGALIP